MPRYPATVLLIRFQLAARYFSFIFRVFLSLKNETCLYSGDKVSWLQSIPLQHTLSLYRKHVGPRRGTSK